MTGYKERARRRCAAGRGGRGKAGPEGSADSGEPGATLEEAHDCLPGRLPSGEGEGPVAHHGARPASGNSAPPPPDPSRCGPASPGQRPLIGGCCPPPCSAQERHLSAACGSAVLGPPAPSLHRCAGSSQGLLHSGPGEGGSWSRRDCSRNREHLGPCRRPRGCSGPRGGRGLGDTEVLQALGDGGRDGAGG